MGHSFYTPIISHTEAKRKHQISDERHKYPRGLITDTLEYPKTDGQAFGPAGVFFPEWKMIRLISAETG
jgi:hypothetical protein